MKLDNIKTIRDNLVNAIIETPKASQNKFIYDPASDLFRLKKTLPLGMVFPFDFGFIPNTTAEDGDPLDILILMDPCTYPGCLVECRLIAVLEAEQREKDTTVKRNDRIIGIGKSSILFKDIIELDQLNKNMLKQIESFFINYNRQENKEFIPLGWKNAGAAMSLVKKQLNEK